MKRILTIAMAVCFSMQLSAQAFWTMTSYKGAFPVTDGTPATDWTYGWTNWDPQNTNYPATTVTVSSDITSNTTWSTGQVVLLQNKVYVKNNSTLTIQPGVIIRGDYASQGALIITTGSKIDAQGTASNPIVFTSNQPVGSRAEGDWGGVVLLGLAKNNQPGGTANIEGITPSADTQFGGSNDADNSGTMKYVRIEFPGIALQPNKEINGLTFGSVGSGTTIDYIQISYSGDDSYEWFGGTVSCKHLISFACIDDDFDTDYGFSGRLQFGLSIRDKDMSDAAGDSNGFESDNDASGTGAFPRTSAIFSNFTMIGPSRNGTVTLPVGHKFERNFYIRRNSAISVWNTIGCSWPKGLYTKDAGTVDNFNNNDSATFAKNIMTSDIGLHIQKDANATQVYYATMFTTNGIDTTSTNANINWVNAFPANMNSTPDYRLNSGSVAATGASFPTSTFTGGFVATEEVTGLEKGNMFLFPNPADDVIHVQSYLATSGMVTFRIIDVAGKVIDSQSRNLSAGGVVTQFSTSELQPGMYFMQSVINGSVETLKFMVK